MSSLDDSVLAVGSGPILFSLVEAWYESGLSRMTIFLSSAQPTDTAGLKKLVEQTLHSDPKASLDILAPAGGGEPDWEAIVLPFQFIFYVSQHGDLEELRKLQQACMAARRPMLPAIAFRGMGIAGPLLHPGGDGRWESAWRRLHCSVFSGDRGPQDFTPTAAAILSNLIVYEWHKEVAGEQEADCSNQCYLLDPVTLNGGWHSFLTHPLDTGYEPALPVTDVELGLKTSHEPADPEEWLAYFNGLTSKVSGIFHVWEEGGLNQLPLAQCLVQPADPLSEGPTQLLPAIVSSCLTHVDARRESGLAGLEAYAARMVPLLFSELFDYQPEYIGVGAGTFAEAVGRGLRACLANKLGKWTIAHELTVTRMECARIEDVRCRFYLQALSTMEGDPLIAVGEPLLGFPVVWVRSGSLWYGSADLTLTLALRQSLQKAVLKADDLAVSAVIWKGQALQGSIISSDDSPKHGSWALSAVQTLKQFGIGLEVFDMRSEAFLREGPFGVYGVMMREEESA
ncbi:MAG: bacteriocin maturation protein [Paenibacillaceae bacterium]|nr:bacteriocin maturation protein [Paenibacillaceae bacterium]